MPELDDLLRRAFDGPPPVSLSEVRDEVMSGRKRRARRRAGAAIAACAALVAGLATVLVVRSSDSDSTVSVGTARPPATTRKVLPTAPVTSGYAAALPASAAKVLSAPLAELAAASRGTTIDKLPSGGIISGQPTLTSDGKPEVLYIGAEFCPYCAAERWPLVAALAKFGTFTNLGTGVSSPSDVNPSTPSFTFYGSSYSSPYITFVAVETTTQDESVPLQTPTAAQQRLWTKLDSDETIPFIDFANKYSVMGASYNSVTMASQSFDFVANQVGNNNTPTGRGIDQAAGAMIRALCQLTDDQPRDVCTAITS